MGWPIWAELARIDRSTFEQPKARGNKPKIKQRFGAERGSYAPFV